MLEIEGKQKTTKNNHKIIGLPFFNGKGTKLKEFSEAVNKLLEKIWEQYWDEVKDKEFKKKKFIVQLFGYF